MESYKQAFTHNGVEKLTKVLCEHGAMVQQVGEMKSFPLELAMIASVLRENKMPQESINVVLAARCGMPMMPVDTKSPCFVWAEDETDMNEIHREAFEKAKSLSVEEVEEVMTVFHSKITEGMANGVRLCSSGCPFRCAHILNHW